MSQFVMFAEIAGVLAGGIVVTWLVVWITNPRPKPARRTPPLRIDSRVQEILPARLRAGISLDAPSAHEFNFETRPETGVVVSHEERWRPTAEG